MNQRFLQRNNARGRRGVTLLEVIVATVVLMVLGLVISIAFVHSKGYDNIAADAAIAALFGGFIATRLIGRQGTRVSASESESPTT